MKTFSLLGGLTALLLSCFPNRTTAQSAFAPASSGARNDRNDRPDKKNG